MGSWYETCGVSKLPIVTDDEVVLILLEKRKFPHKIGFYVDDIYAPISTPIYGKYDDDYGVIDCYTNKNTENYILNLKLMVDGKEKSFKDIDEFVKMLHYEDMQISDSFGDTDLAYFICHKKLFNMLIDNIKSRNNYEGKNYGENIDLFYKTYFKDLQKKYSEASEDDKRFFFFTQNIDVLSDLDFFASRTSPTHFKKMIEKFIISDVDDDTINEVIKIKLFSDALDCGRMGYFTTSGKGSQDREYFIHLIIAKFINEKCEEEWEKYKEENILSEGETKEKFLQEGIHWYFSRSF